MAGSGVCIFLPRGAFPSSLPSTFCLLTCWCTGRQCSLLWLYCTHSQVAEKESKSKRDSDREGKRGNISFASAQGTPLVLNGEESFYPLELFPRLLLPKCNSLGVKAWKKGKKGLKKKKKKRYFFLTLSWRIVHSCISRVYSYIVYKIVHSYISLFVLCYFWVLNWDGFRLGNAGGGKKKGKLNTDLVAHWILGFWSSSSNFLLFFCFHSPQIARLCILYRFYNSFQWRER